MKGLLISTLCTISICSVANEMDGHLSRAIGTDNGLYVTQLDEYGELKLVKFEDYTTIPKKIRKKMKKMSKKGLVVIRDNQEKEELILKLSKYKNAELEQALELIPDYAGTTNEFTDNHQNEIQPSMMMQPTWGTYYIGNQFTMVERMNTVETRANSAAGCDFAICSSNWYTRSYEGNGGDINTYYEYEVVNVEDSSQDGSGTILKEHCSIEEYMCYIF